MMKDLINVCNCTIGTKGWLRRFEVRRYPFGLDMINL